MPILILYISNKFAHLHYDSQIFALTIYVYHIKMNIMISSVGMAFAVVEILQPCVILDFSTLNLI
jgi:hypothetical protein